MLVDLIKKLNEEEGMNPPLLPNDQGQYTFPFDDLISIIINDINPGIRLFCAFHPYPNKAEEVILTNMMHGNLFGQGTKGAVLGVSEDGKNLTISRDIEYNIEYKDFKEILEDFLNMVDYWHAEIANEEEGV